MTYHHQLEKGVTVTERRFMVDDLITNVPYLHGSDTERAQAQHNLLHAADTVISYWTRTEHQRAIMQFPTVEIDDVRQIIMFHFLTALDDLSLDKVQTSSTNWLYHRVATGTRRELSNTYGQVKFSRYFLENARRTRAIITRLESELERTPTDAEILTASGMAGQGGLALGPKSRTLTTRKPLTAHFLQTYREHQHALESTELPEDDYLTHPSPEDSTTEQAAADALRDVYVRAATAAGISQDIVNIVFCCFGITPWNEAHDIKETAHILHISPEQVTAVLSAWATWCSAPGGSFHHQLTLLDEDTAADLGLARVRTALGAFRGTDTPVSPVLLAS